jgi:hypothetical protein
MNLLHHIRRPLQKSCILLCLLLCTGLLSCSKSHIIHTQEKVSRDYTYIDFVRNPDPLSLRTSVGGEHIKAVKILGFEGDKYLVEFTNHSGTVRFQVAGEGILFKKTDPNRGTIFIRDIEAIAAIETWAHPSAEYTLSITPLKPLASKGFSLFFWQD